MQPELQHASLALSSNIAHTLQSISKAAKRGKLQCIVYVLSLGSTNPADEVLQFVALHSIANEPPSLAKTLS